MEEALDLLLKAAKNYDNQLKDMQNRLKRIDSMQNVLPENSICNILENIQDVKTLAKKVEKDSNEIQEEYVKIVDDATIKESEALLNTLSKLLISLRKNGNGDSSDTF